MSPVGFPIPDGAASVSGKNAFPFQNVILSVLAGLGIEILTEQEGFNGRKRTEPKQNGNRTHVSPHPVHGCTRYVFHAGTGPV